MYRRRHNTVPTPDDSSSLLSSSSSSSSDEDDSYSSDSSTTKAPPPPPPLSIGSRGRVSHMIDLFDTRASTQQPSPASGFKPTSWTDYIPENRVHNRIKQLLQLSPQSKKNKERKVRKKDRKKKRNQFINEYIDSSAGKHARKATVLKHKVVDDALHPEKEKVRRKTFGPGDSYPVPKRTPSKKITSRDHDGSPEEEHTPRPVMNKAQNEAPSTGQKKEEPVSSRKTPQKVKDPEKQKEEPTTTPSKNSRKESVPLSPKQTANPGQQAQTPRSRKPIKEPQMPKEPQVPPERVPREIPSRTYGSYAFSALKRTQSRASQASSGISRGLTPPYKVIDNLSKYAEKPTYKREEPKPKKSEQNLNEKVRNYLASNIPSHSTGVPLSSQDSTRSPSPSLTAQLEEMEEIRPIPGYHVAPPTYHQHAKEPFLEPYYDPRPAPLFSPSTQSHNPSHLQLPSAAEKLVRKTPRNQKSAPSLKQESKTNHPVTPSKKKKNGGVQQRAQESSGSEADIDNVKVPKRVVSDTHWMNEKPRKPSKSVGGSAKHHLPRPPTDRHDPHHDKQMPITAYQPAGHTKSFKQPVVRGAGKHLDPRHHRYEEPEESTADTTSVESTCVEDVGDEERYDEEPRGRGLYMSNTFKARTEQPHWQEPLRRPVSPTSEVSTENVTAPSPSSTVKGLSREPTMVSIRRGRYKNKYSPQYDEYYSEEENREDSVLVKHAEGLKKRLLSRSKSTGAFLAPGHRGSSNRFTRRKTFDDNDESVIPLV